ncbi:MAG: hypothetical protein ACUVX1_00485 [Chloroflexota bacterium]
MSPVVGPLPVVLFTLALLVAVLALGLIWVFAPAVAVRAVARLAYRIAVQTRRGHETFVATELLFFLGAKTPEEGLSKLQGMKDDPKRAAPGVVLWYRVLGLYFVAFAGLVLFLIIGQLIVGGAPSG